MLLLERPDTSTTIFPKQFCQGCGSAPRIPAPGPEAGDTGSPVLRVSRTRPTHSCGAQRWFVSLKTTVQNGGGLERPPNGDNQGRLPPRVDSEHPGGGHPGGGYPGRGHPGGSTQGGGTRGEGTWGATGGRVPGVRAPGEEHPGGGHPGGRNRNPGASIAAKPAPGGSKEPAFLRPTPRSHLTIIATC